jgi:hypothetical protein
MNVGYDVEGWSEVEPAVRDDPDGRDLTKPYIFASASLASSIIIHELPVVFCSLLYATLVFQLFLVNSTKR